MQLIALERCTYAIRRAVIIDELSLTIDANRLTAVMGPSGAGKTTLLRLIGRDISPLSGEISSPYAARQTGWVPQNAPLLPRRTAIDNAALGALSRGATRSQALDSASNSLEQVGLASKANRVAKTLSGGERQRVAVARALSAGAELLLADEPTASLDAASRDAVISAFRRICTSGGTVLIATHDEGAAAQADAIVRMQDGKVRSVS